VLTGYAVTATAARAGTEGAGPALLLTAVAVGHSPSQAALLLSAFTLSAALAGPSVGVALDRATHPRRVVAAALLGLAGCLALLAWTLSGAPYAVIIVIALAAGIGEPALTGGWSALLATMVPAGSMARAFAVDAATYNVGAIVGPALVAGSLVLGPRVPLVVVITLALLAVVALPLVPLRPGDPDRPRASARAGVRALVGTPSLRAVTVVSTVGFAGQAALLVAAPALSRQLTDSLRAAGWLYVAFAAGGLLSSAVLTRHPLRRPQRAVTIGTVIVAVGLAGVALAGTLTAALLAAAVTGCGDGPMITGMFTVRAREAPAAARSTVFTAGASVRTLAYALACAGLALLLGLGPRTVLALGVALQGVALAAGALSRGHRRRAAGVAEPSQDGDRATG